MGEQLMRLGGLTSSVVTGNAPLLKPGDICRMIVKNETGTGMFHLEFSTRQ
jgi:hypothetical protein